MAKLARSSLAMQPIFHPTAHGSTKNSREARKAGVSTCKGPAVNLQVHQSVMEAVKLSKEYVMQIV